MTPDAPTVEEIVESKLTKIRPHWHPCNALRKRCECGAVKTHATLRPILLDLVDRVSRERTRQALERAEKEVPTNWCDPLLAAPTLQGKPGTWDCRDIERLLIGVRAAIRGLSDGESVASEEKEE